MLEERKIDLTMTIALAEKRVKRFDFTKESIYRVVTVSGDPYAASKMQKRNEWMVDNSKSVIAALESMACYCGI